MQAADPLVRWVAAIILIVTFVGQVAIVVHGYWVDQAYTIPSFLAAMLGSEITGAAGYLGIHIVTGTTIRAVGTGAEVTRQAAANGTSEKPKAA